MAAAASVFATTGTESAALTADAANNIAAAPTLEKRTVLMVNCSLIIDGTEWTRSEWLKSS
jgi:hypothetical protein